MISIEVYMVKVILIYLFVCLFITLSYLPVCMFTLLKIMYCYFLMYLYLSVCLSIALKSCILNHISLNFW